MFRKPWTETIKTGRAPESTATKIICPDLSGKGRKKWLANTAPESGGCSAAVYQTEGGQEYGFGKIEKLVNIIEKSSMLEFSIQEGDTKIKMSRRGSAEAPVQPMTVNVSAASSQMEEAEDEATSPLP